MHRFPRRFAAHLGSILLPLIGAGLLLVLQGCGTFPDGWDWPDIELEDPWGVETNAPPVEPPAPPPEPVPAPPPPPPVDNGLDGAVRWDKGGVDGGAAIETVKLRNVAWSTGGIRYTADAGWPKTGEAGTASYGCFFIRGNDGVWSGGKFEWARTGRDQTRQWHNLRDGYRGHRMPRTGERVAFCLLKLDRRERSDFVTWTWP